MKAKQFSRTAITNWNRAPSRILHTAAPRALSYLDEPAVVVEIHNIIGYDFRYAADDSIFSPDHLIATNHHRILYPPIPCWRYSLLQDSISLDPQMTLDRFWWFMENCTGSNYTLMTLLFLPEVQKIGIAFCDSLEQSWEKDPVWIEWNQLFPPEGIEEGISSNSLGLSLIPNPFLVSLAINFETPLSGPVVLQIFDLSGRLVETLIAGDLQEGSHTFHFISDGYSPGVYLIRLQSSSMIKTKRCVLLR